MKSAASNGASVNTVSHLELVQNCVQRFVFVYVSCFSSFLGRQAFAGKESTTVSVILDVRALTIAQNVPRSLLF